MYRRNTKMYRRNTKMSVKLGASNIASPSLSNPQISAFLSLQFHKLGLSCYGVKELETCWTDEFPRHEN